MGSRSRSLVAACLLVFAAIAAVPSGVHAAELLLTNGHIYTGVASAPWVGGLAVENGRITATGSSDEILARRKGDSRVTDLQGQTVIPGIVDGHVHSLFGSMALYGLNLWSDELSVLPEDAGRFTGALRDYAAKHPGDKILFARSIFAVESSKAPGHELLDRAVSDRPLIVHNISEHALWLNARALAMTGLTAQKVSDPAEEAGIVRGPDGKPSGVLREASMEIVERVVQKTLTQDEKLTLLRAGQKYLNTFGITSVVNATGSLAEIELYGALRDRHQLTVRTRTAFGAVAVPHHLTPEFLHDLDEARTRYHDDWVSAGVVKFFADGAGAAAPTVYPPEDYQRLILDIDKRGYQIMTHALRADSVHMILDAYQKLEQQNGARDRRLRIEHAIAIENTDIPRFGALSVTASMQPSFCCEAGQPPSDPWGSLARTGAKLVFSSDWPCTWPPDPFVAMQELVTRFGWSGPGYGAGQGTRVMDPKPVGPSERLTIMQAVDGYTREAARAAFRDTLVGTLERGKLADLAVLSQDIFSAAPENIGKTHVTLTMVGGEVVYQAKR